MLHPVFNFADRGLAQMIYSINEIKAAINAYKNKWPITKDDLHATSKKMNISFRRFSQLLKIILLGSFVSLPITLIIELLGKKEVHKRFSQANQWIQKKEESK